jgi:hypothetical protein
MPIAEAVSASSGIVETSPYPGKSGQVIGAVKVALPFVASANIAAIRVVRTQWCAPWRRQQAGRRESSFAGRVAASGPRPKNATRRMESQRRIWESCYMRNVYEGTECHLRDTVRYHLC